MKQTNQTIDRPLERVQPTRQTDQPPTKHGDVEADPHPVIFNFSVDGLLDHYLIEPLADPLVERNLHSAADADVSTLIDRKHGYGQLLKLLAGLARISKVKNSTPLFASTQAQPLHHCLG